ncbi:class I SAM-dependent methyltransferase [Halarsenatibacter silvermanii]|uniref:Methyltransferase small domain-containing protein n=1 Tax=Halarsenatibacter silvermanii TaxID=321763 RepID=A0A1G9S6Z3_9FIRM|nr:class I SAM-dependent methyltransferase [Halarsenatibacter silvermanii]SDM31194.1 Methyltransferase small domain-containing protein [Halarsenatibacter silvermanii]
MAVIKKITGKFERACRGNKRLFKIYSLPYRNAVLREVKLGNIGEDDVVLNIGCGGLPFTAYYLARLSQARVVAVDVDLEAINSAQKLFSENNFPSLESEIEFAVMCGCRAAVELNYDIIVAALQTENKLEMIKILDDNPGGWKFITREPRKIFGSQYESLSSKVNPSDSVGHYFPTFDRSILIESGGLSF